MKARVLSTGAILAALSAALLLASGMMGTGKVATLVLVSVLPLVLTLEKQYWAAAASSMAALALAFLLLPDKMLPIAYGLFFAWFAMLWTAIRPFRPALRVSISFAAFNLAWAAFLLLMKSWLWQQMPFAWVLLAGEPAFAAYLLLFKWIASYYERRFRKVIWRE